MIPGGSASSLGNLLCGACQVSDSVMEVLGVVLQLPDGVSRRIYGHKKWFQLDSLVREDVSFDVYETDTPLP